MRGEVGWKWGHGHAGQTGAPSGKAPGRQVCAERPRPAFLEGPAQTDPV